MINNWSLKISDSSNVASNATVTEFELPNIETEFDTDRRISYISEVPLPIGFKITELSFTAKTISPSFFAVLASVGKINFIFTGVDVSLNVFNTTQALITGYVANVPLGSFSSSGSEYEVNAMITRLEVLVNGEQTLLFSPETYEYTVNGVNQLAYLKTAFGR